ncbi:MAG: N-acetyl-alpha-D-glucosaminyl L-malate synthase BshA [Acidobacteria bacterium]|nr:N-acetyl-alpha-D-glucosaminyl L-malate synthase BshA [Acidobacteriota bacterium]
MKIGILCHPTYGGSGIVASELAKRLARRGHTVHLFSYALPVRVPVGHENVFFHRVEVSAYPLFRYPSYDLELAARIVDVARNRGLDLLHAHYAVPHGVSALLAKDILADEGARLPVVTTLHGTDITIVGSQPSFSPVTRHILERSDALTAVSRHLADETAAVFGTRRPVEVVPNFVDPDVFKPRRPGEFRRRLAAKGERVLVHLSNFRPVKNLPRIIRVFGRVLERVPSRLVLVGDGPDHDRAVETCRTLGLGDRVVFPGMQLNAAEYLAAADLYLQASDTESFGLSALEAMACGVPVVSPAVGGVPEVVADGETGYLTRPGDEAMMADAAVRLLTKPKLRRRFARAGRARAVERFSPDPVVSRYEAVYEKVLRASGGAPGPLCPEAGPGGSP